VKSIRQPEKRKHRRTGRKRGRVKHRTVEDLLTSRILTPKQGLFLAAFAESRNKTKAAIAAKYGGEPRKAGYQAYQGLLEKAPDVIAKMGITLESVIDNYVLRHMNATETKLAQHEGKYTDAVEVENLELQHRATRTLLELMGAFPGEDEKVGSKPDIEYIVLDLPKPDPLPPLIRPPKPSNGNPPKAQDPRDDPNFDPRPKD
jgi:hypothetical protein